MTGYRTKVRWSDLDANGHARNSAYSEYAAGARVAYLAEHGFTVARFRELGLGMIVFTEYLRYRRELLLGDAVEVASELVALSPSGHRWAMRHAVTRGDTLVATVELTGSWLDLERRKVATPHEGLAEVMRSMPRASDFAELAERSTVATPDR